MAQYNQNIGGDQMAVMRCVSQPVFVSLIDPCSCIEGTDEDHTPSIVFWQDVEVLDTSVPVDHSNIVRVIQQGIGFTYNCSSDLQLHTISISDSAMFDILARIQPILSDCSARWDWLSARLIDATQDPDADNFEHFN